MMKIVGHRGAAGLALENSGDSISAALQYDLEAIEFDVRLTADGHVVIMHDPHTKRVASQKVHVRKKTLAELRNLSLHNKQSIPTLDDVLGIIESGRVIIDMKAKGTAEALLPVLKKYPKITPSFSSFIPDELITAHKLFPDAKIYLGEHFSPIEVIYNAKRLHANGITLNKWLINPLTYRMAKRYNLEFFVYTLNNRFLARFYELLYPDVTICTDHPERFAKRRKRSRANPPIVASATQK